MKPGGVNPPPIVYDPIRDGTQWMIFADTGKASLAIGDTITQAIASWKKQRGAKAGNPVGVIRLGYSETVPESFNRTDVFGVVCCVHRPPVDQAAAIPEKRKANNGQPDRKKGK